MGSVASKLFQWNDSEIHVFNRKRNYTYDDEYEGTKDRSAPKKRRLASLGEPDFIYKELFKEGVYSDIKIVACGKQWNLHKVHLKQCPYFASMLSGAWKEANQDVITIDVVDPNITAEALDLMFGSLYLNEIEIDVTNIIPLLAAASHFQMDRLVDRCAEVMIDNINTTNVLIYHGLADQYGLEQVRKATRGYLNINFVTNKHLWPILPEISIEMMTSLISSWELIVNVTEQHVYLVAIRWMYRHLTRKKEKRLSDQHILAYFLSKTESAEEFLLQPEGEPYQPVFRALRMKDVLINTIAAQLLSEARIIPQEWIRQALAQNYMELMAVHEGHDAGPTEIDDADIETRGMRLCRNVKTNGVSWRWQGVMAGLFLYWQFSNNVLEVMRLRSTDHAFLTNSMRERHFICRATLIVTNAKRPLQLTSPTTKFSLIVGQKVQVLRLPDKYKPPVVVQVLLLTTSKQVRVNGTHQSLEDS